MKRTSRKSIRTIAVAFLLLTVGLGSVLHAAEPTYKADVPKEILTPDMMTSTYIGKLSFQDGFPTAKTSAKVSDFVDTSRAVELFLSGAPTASMYAMLQGHVNI